MVAEASVDGQGRARVHRAVIAIDCGQIVNPAFIEAQLQSAVTLGLTAALNGEITIRKGRVQESNFDNYTLLTIEEMPVVEAYVVPSMEAPGGVGEPGVPVVAPAVANALFAATGKRIRKLPFPKLT
jgi:isoquinoline 1-oxidoreductase beta subunit